MTRFIVGFAVLAGLSALGGAANLDLSYVESSLGGGMYSYTMTLGVSTSSSAWAPGMGWGWLVFGDVATGSSPLADFTMTSSFPVGPWTSLSNTSGGHNGPNFSPVYISDWVYWIPSSATDTLTWTGKSSYNAAAQGPLYFSDLVTTGGATSDNFALMTPSTPEPMTLLAIGGGILGLVRRRRSRS